MEWSCQASRKAELAAGASRVQVAKPGAHTFCDGLFEGSEHSVSLPRISILAHPRGPVLRTGTRFVFVLNGPLPAVWGWGLLLRDVIPHRSGCSRTGCGWWSVCSALLLAPVSWWMCSCPACCFTWYSQGCFLTIKGAPSCVFHACSELRVRFFS